MFKSVRWHANGFDNVNTCVQLPSLEIEARRGDIIEVTVRTVAGARRVAGVVCSGGIVHLKGHGRLGERGDPMTALPVTEARDTGLTIEVDTDSIRVVRSWRDRDDEENTR
jgi:hypothetical protein